MERGCKRLGPDPGPTSTQRNCSRCGRACGYCERLGRRWRRTVDASQPTSSAFDLNRETSGQPSWAIVTALRGAEPREPVRDWATVGCDGDAGSSFASVHGEPGDMRLLSQSFDDAIAQMHFGPPSGTVSLGYVSESDEAGFLFGGVLEFAGDTGVRRTTGDGGPACKDALVSMTIRTP